MHSGNAGADYALSHLGRIMPGTIRGECAAITHAITQESYDNCKEDLKEMSVRLPPSGREPVPLPRASTSQTGHI